MRHIAWLGVAACLCFFSWRLFAAPIIGIANNGDFSKIAGRLRLGPASGVEDDRFLYVTRAYKRSAQYEWDSQYRSSESSIAWAADRLARVFQGGDRFDIRWMGLLHLLVVMGALVWLTAALAPLGVPVQLAAVLSVGFIFGDAAYLGYFNSFYTDAAALVGALLTAAALTDLAIRGSSPWRLAGLLAGALLLVTSKTQHTLLVVAIVAVLWVLTNWRSALICGLVLVAAAALFVRSSPAFYRGDPIFNLIFFKLTPQSPDPPADLAALGLDSAEVRYIGMHAYSPGAPTGNMDFLLELARRVSMARLAQFYLARPKRAAAILEHDLAGSAVLIQPTEFGNYTADSGRPPHARASGYWTGPESQLLARLPWLMPLWLAGMAIACLWVRSKAAWVCLAITAMAAMEYGVASLADALETTRHLLLFHVWMEITFCFALAAVADRFYRSRSSS